MRVDSKMSLQQALAEEQKISLIQEKAQAKIADPNVKRHNHELQCRIDGAFLPLSVDLLPSNDIQKAIHKINNKKQFDQVVEIGIREVNEENFISQLHGIEVAKMDKLLGKESKKEKTSASNKQTEDRSKEEAGGTSSLADADDPRHKKSETQTRETTPMTLSEPSEAQKQALDKLKTNSNSMQVSLPRKVREKVTNPLFDVEERPAVLDVLFKDVIRVYNVDENLDIFAYKSEDYLDDIRLLKEFESVSLDVRVAHDLVDQWVHYIRPRPKTPPKKKRKKKYKQGKAHTSMISIAEISIGNNNSSNVKHKQSIDPSRMTSSADVVDSESLSKTN